MKFPPPARARTRAQVTHTHVRFQSVAAAESVCRVMLRFVTFDREALFQRASDGQVTACCTFN